MTSLVATTAELVKSVYEKMPVKLAQYRKELGRPLTLAEKILFSHLDAGQNVAELKRGQSFIMLRPDRVAMQDATAQMAILQFMQSGKKSVAVPSTVHCDHLIVAHKGIAKDMSVANSDNSEVFSFLKTASEKYGIGFWGPGAGIIHQVILENYAFPGGLMIGTDSHTPNAGGLGMLACGVGGADAVDVMAGFPWELLNPKIVGVKLTGRFQPWASPKDVILKVLEKLTVAGGTNKIVEYFGPGASSISCTGKATITNMGAELGATCSVFAYDSKMSAYLKATKRSDLAKLADEFSEHLRPDPEVEANPTKYYDEVIEIDLDKLEPYMVGPHSPDKARGISTFKAEIEKEGYPDKVSAALIGSCTNSSYEDIYKAASIAREALKVGVKAAAPFFISPGSAQVAATIKRDGLLQTLEDFGGTLLANACGPCIGQWTRDDIKSGDVNSIVTSFNRNFRGRNDSNPETLAFIGSPEMVVAYAASGRLSFDPRKDVIRSPNGQEVKLTAPVAPELPEKGFVEDMSGYIEPALDSSKVVVDVSETSERLQILKPFVKWDGRDFVNHRLLVKAKGKCTTDHISPAGKWLRFRGHLDRISDNMLLGATNFFQPEPGKGLNQLTGARTETLSAIARQYKKAGERWVVAGDDNYGEGSSREHAAMSPRFLGASTVLVKTFARIHETNLKKQGVLAITFRNPSDYDKIKETDQVSVIGLSTFKPGVDLTLKLTHQDGSSESFPVKHSYNQEQIEWFKAGSALNLI
jgi:aconitate hydratase